MSRIALAVIGVLFVKGMTVNTMSFGCVHRREASPAHGVFSVVNYLKVNGVHTPTNTAKMVTLLRRGQRIVYEHLPHYPMRILGFSSHCHDGVAVRVYAACPQPTGSAFVSDGGVNLNLFKQAGHAGQKGVPLDESEFAVLALAASSFTTFLALTANTVRVCSVGVELRARQINVAFTTSLKGDKIGIGHRCLQLGNVT